MCWLAILPWLDPIMGGGPVGSQAGLWLDRGAVRVAVEVAMFAGLRSREG